MTMTSAVTSRRYGVQVRVSTAACAACRSTRTSSRRSTTAANCTPRNCDWRAISHESDSPSVAYRPIAHTRARHSPVATQRCCRRFSSAVGLDHVRSGFYMHRGFYDIRACTDLHCATFLFSVLYRRMTIFPWCCLGLGLSGLEVCFAEPYTVVGLMAVCKLALPIR